MTRANGKTQNQIGGNKKITQTNNIKQYSLSKDCLREVGGNGETNKTNNKKL